MPIGARPPPDRSELCAHTALQHTWRQRNATRPTPTQCNAARRRARQHNPACNSPNQPRTMLSPPQKNPQGPAYPRCSPHAEGLAAPCPPQPIRCGVELPKPPRAPTWGGCCPHVRGIKHCQGLCGIVQVGPCPITRWGTKGTATRLGCPRAPGTSATSATSGAGDVGDDDGKKRSPRSSPNTPQPPPLPFPGAA